MHFIMRDPSTGNTVGILCAERAAGFGVVLQATDISLGTLIEIARSQKVPYVYMIVPEEAAAQLRGMGWSDSTHRLMTYNLNGNG